MFLEHPIFFLIGLGMLLSVKSPLGAQPSDVHSIVRLDTIINTGVPKDVSMAIRFAAASTEKEFWLYIPSKSHPDSLLFLRYDYLGRTIDTCWGILSPREKRPVSPIGVDLAVDDNHCALLFYDRVAVFDIRKGNGGKARLVEESSFPVTSPYKYIGIQGSTLVLARSYNFHPHDAPTPTEISLYDISRRRFTRKITPGFKYVELSHFAPNHWIDASTNNILFTQTSEYHVDIYDPALHKKSELTRTPPDWREIDPVRMDQIHALPIFQLHIIKALIDTLSPVEDVVSRVESAQFVGDSAMLVRYIPADGKRRGRERRYDVWRFKDGEWQLRAADLRDVRPAPETTCSHDNYPFLAVYNPTYCTSRRIVKVMPDVELQQFGKTYRALAAERDDAIAEREPTYHIVIYTLTLPE